LAKAFLATLQHMATAAAPAAACVLRVQLGAAKTLRSIVVYVASIASLTMNLPPISAAPRLWEGFGEAMG
jgi:hypothetical protein